MPHYMGFPSVEAFCAFKVDTLTRREGDEVAFGVMDNLDPTQRESSVLFWMPCSCALTPEQSDVPYCSCGAAGRAVAVTADLRRQYATQIDLTGSVRVGAKVAA